MSHRVVVRPPFDIYTTEHLAVDQPLIFLAGPIKGAPPWHEKAIGIIHDINPRVIIACPKRKDFIAGDLSDKEFQEQERWENYAQGLARQRGVTLFWFPRPLVEEDSTHPYGENSRLQLGGAMVWHEVRHIRLVVGIEAGFPGERLIRVKLVAHCPGVRTPLTLADTCSAALGIFNGSSLSTYAVA